jgi:glycosyltransferase involved in cell wall biosynthesis
VPASNSSVALDLLSPLPPVRSGIADYTLDLLPHLIRRADVRLVAIPGQEVSDEVRERFRPVPYDDTFGGDGRLPLYQMGNNLYHREVAQVALERPGVLTLHDLVLHHLASEITLGVRDFDAYSRRLSADHGWVGQAAARPRLWGAQVEAMLFELPAHRRLLRAQRGILVHNRWAADRLLEAEPELRVEVVSMGIPLPPRADEAAGREVRRRYGIPEDAPVIGSFGFQTPIKRTDRVVRALTRPGLEDVHLLVVGQSPPDSSLGELAAELGVADRVTETGFVPFDEMTAAIAASDLASNLRYPTAGETSASLLRVLAVGRPVIVSDHAQFAELPDAVAVKVALGDGEEEALAARIAELLASPGRLREMGRAAREHIARNHRPEDAAAHVVRACAAWADAEDAEPLDRLDPDATPWAPPPTSLTWSRLDGEIAVDGTDNWSPGERRHLGVTVTNNGPAVWLPADEGPGGVALEVCLGDEILPWLPLPVALAPGEAHRFEIPLRRPLDGSSGLTLALQVAGNGGPFFAAPSLMVPFEEAS